MKETRHGKIVTRLRKLVWQAKCSELEQQAKDAKADKDSILWAIIAGQLLEGAREYVSSRVLRAFDTNFIDDFVKENNLYGPKSISFMTLVRLGQENPTKLNRCQLGFYTEKFFEMFAERCQEMNNRRNLVAHPNGMLLQNEDYRKKSLHHVLRIEIS